MKTIKRTMVCVLFGLVLSALPAPAGVEAYAAMGIDKSKVISATQTTARVLPGDDKQLVCLVAYLTGMKERNAAVKLRLAVLEVSEGKHTPVWEQDFSAKYGGNAGEGNLELLDLDRDGQLEIIVTFDLFSEPLIRQRFGEVIVWEEDGFKTAWSGPFEYGDRGASSSRSPIVRITPLWPTRSTLVATLASSASSPRATRERNASRSSPPGYSKPAAPVCQFEPEPGALEARLSEEFLQPRDWLGKDAD